MGPARRAPPRRLSSKLMPIPRSGGEQKLPLPSQSGAQATLSLRQVVRRAPRLRLRLVFGRVLAGLLLLLGRRLRLLLLGPKLLLGRLLAVRALATAAVLNYGHVMLLFSDAARIGRREVSA